MSKCVRELQCHLQELVVSLHVLAFYHYHFHATLTRFTCHELYLPLANDKVRTMSSCPVLGGMLLNRLEELAGQAQDAVSVDRDSSTRIDQMAWTPDTACPVTVSVPNLNLYAVPCRCPGTGRRDLHQGRSLQTHC